MNQGKISDIIKVEHHYQPANSASELVVHILHRYSSKKHEISLTTTHI